MPELPEVETVRRGLQPAMEGATIESVELRRPDLRFPFPARFAARLSGRRVDSLQRRAKYLLAHLDDGNVWPTGFAVLKLTPEDESRITAIVRRAVS